MSSKAKRELAQLLADRSNDHKVATVARVAAGAIGLFAGVVVLRSLPALVRYVKMERM